ncbi:hypothetical protein [Microscilla marina]|nr:hypothetical protein [Microscilla marina]
MIQIFVFIFYMALNLVPAKTTQFKMEMHNPDNDKEVVVLEFKQQKDQWAVVPSHKPDDVLFFRFDKQQHCYVKDGIKGKEEKVDLLNKMHIVPNHKKWKKVTKVVFDLKKEQEGSPRHLVFMVAKDGKKKRIISIDKKAVPDMSKAMPEMHLTWK